ncbi:uncharacterized protein LOC133799721 [Humulus lupulus]|uniref:uncharacterized protein LOC133799721 n=1 Tax=Humulus lupulus TaxID=3486 RepID=UPI002B4109B4|nr:uncharacterized protein LOC133799721 [Humulus lupulus]
MISFCQTISRPELEAAVIKGKFQLGSFYTQRLMSECVAYARPVWSKLSMPTHRFILWQAVNHHLLTRDLLGAHHISVANFRCPVCDLVEESHGHLFFECIFSRKVLLLVSGWLGGITWPGKFEEWIAWLSNWKSDWLHSLMAASLVACTYFIWYNRNASCFNESCFTVFTIDYLIRQAVKARVLNVNSRHLSTRERQMIEFVKSL